MRFGTKVLFICLVFCCAVFADVRDDEKSLVPQGNPEEFQMPVYADDIVAIVNGEIITMTQLMIETGPFIPKIRAESRSQSDFQKRVRECQEFILNAFIERMLIVADFKARGGKMPDIYEKNEYEMRIHNWFNDDRVAFAKYLRDNGQSVREFKKNIREHAIVEFILRSLNESKTEVSPAKIKEYYDEHIDRFVVDRQIFVKEIALSVEKYTAAGLQTKLSSLINAIGAGEDIQSLIKNFSDFPRNSEIGWIAVDDMIPAFANALRGLAPGEFTKSISLENKVCVLYVEDEKPPKKFTLDEVSDDIERTLTSKYQAEVRENYIKKLKEKAYVKIFL